MLVLSYGNEPWKDEKTHSPSLGKPTSDEGENWDDEVGTHSYNAKRESEKKPIFRTNTGLTKAEKRHFECMERERIFKIKKEEADD